MVAAGHSGVISVPLGGNTTSKTSHTPSLTWISAARSGVSARLRRIGAIHLIRKAPLGIIGRPIDRPGDCGSVPVKSSVMSPVLLDHLERELVQPGLAHAVVLDMVVARNIRRRRSLE